MNDIPKTLYHGTSAENIDAIKTQGLIAVDERVFLSSDRNISKEAGDQKGEGVVLQIDTDSMVTDGFLFSNISDDIWLVKHVPSKYIN